MSPQAVAVVGAGALGRVVAEIVCEAPDCELVGVYDESAVAGVATLAGCPVQPLSDLLAGSGRPAVVIAIGSVAARKRLHDVLSQHGFSFARVVSSRAIIDPNVRIEDGAIVKAGAILESRAVVEANAVIGTGSVIGHDCHVGQHSYLQPSVTLTGFVRVGEETTLGAGVIANPKVVISGGSTVAPGTVLLEDYQTSPTAPR